MIKGMDLLVKIIKVNISKRKNSSRYKKGHFLEEEEEEGRSGQIRE